MKLKVTNLTKTYKTPSGVLPVLNSLDFNAGNGEFVCILGPSGCGKSTLFHILSGIESSDSGKIAIQGQETENGRGRFGYMFQNDLLLPWRTALDNITLGLEIKGYALSEAKKEAGKLLKKFHLEKFALYYPSALSGGMKQRIALLRTIAFNSDILLLDEPFGSLDALTRLSLQKYLLEIWKKLHLTILFITHDVNEAVTLADKIIVLSNCPAKIIRSIDVNISRPRNLEKLASSHTIEIEKELMSLLVKDPI